MDHHQNDCMGVSTINHSHSWVTFLKTSAILSVCLAIVLGYLGFYAIIWGIANSWAEDPELGPADEPHSDGENAGGGGPSFFEILIHFPTAVLENMKGNIFRLFFAITGAFFIVFAEKTLQLGDIDLSNAPLTATSQLIPFLVGVFSSIPVLWESIKKTSRDLAKQRWVRDFWPGGIFSFGNA